MLTHLTGVLEVDKGELSHAYDSEHENEEHQEKSETTHRGRRTDQCLENLLQLLLLFDESEDTTNSQRTQNGAENSDAFTEAGPVYREDYDCTHDHGEIEQVPVVLKVVFLLRDDLHDGFNGEDDHEDVVYDLNRVLVRIWLHVPVEAEDERVCHNANHNEHVEEGMLRHCDAEVSQPCIVARRYELPLRFCIQCNQRDGNPRELLATKGPVATQKLLLIVECLNDHTNEELHEEHADKDNENHRVDIEEGIVILLRLIVWVDRVN